MCSSAGDELPLQEHTSLINKTHKTHRLVEAQLTRQEAQQLNQFRSCGRTIIEPASFVQSHYWYLRDLL